MGSNPTPRILGFHRTRTDAYNGRAGSDWTVRPSRVKGFKKHLKKVLDEANVDHERKMIFEGHFTGTRAIHYTYRDCEQLQDVIE